MFTRCHVWTQHRCLSTIFALSSGRPPSAIAIIRLSGPDTRKCIQLMTIVEHLHPRQLFYTPVRHPISGELLDRAMAVYMPGPHSSTGEDCAEFHVHGGRAIIDAVLEAIASIDNCRYAQPGEFSRRAFINGKLDLTGVEALADLIGANTSAQRRQALEQFDGRLGKFYNDEVIDVLARAVARLEAHIDFAEEHEVDDETLKQVSESVRQLIDRLSNHLNASRRAQRIHDGIRIVMLGRTNVGKSTLINWLCQFQLNNLHYYIYSGNRPVSIVSQIAGTTRDSIDAHINIAGYPVMITDTAGVRQSTDVIEREGVARSQQRAQSADLIVMVMDASDPHLVNNLQSNIEQILMECNVDIESSTIKLVVVINKIDLVTTIDNRLPDHVNLFGKCNMMVPICHVSCVTEYGLDRLDDELKSMVTQICSIDNNSLSTTVFSRQRHRDAIERALKELHQYESMMIDSALAAQTLRNALYHVGCIVGHVHNEQLLDLIFAEFCIVHYAMLNRMNVATVTAKRQLRRQMGMKLKSLSMDNVRQQSDRVTEQVLAHPAYISARCISIYVSTDGEIGTDAIILNSLSVGKQCYIPRFAPGAVDLQMVRLHTKVQFDTLPKTLWNIRQPPIDEHLEDVFDCVDGGLDLILVPGVAFTVDGRRLGHGRGYYDRFLRTYQTRFADRQMPTLIGLALREQMCSDVPFVDDRDVRLDQVLHD